MTLVNVTTGSITPLAITVTAAADTKGYDGGTAASASPAVTGGSIATGDTAAFTEWFDNKNAGSGKTLAPAGSVSDGNGGSNYARDPRQRRHRFDCYPWRSRSRRLPTPRVTTAARLLRPGRRSPAAASPPATRPPSPSGSTTRTRAAARRSRRPARSATATAAATTRVTLVNVATGSIATRAITVTATTDTKGYDGGTVASAAPTITGGSLATGDTAAFTE